jgi:hypothetical protein
MDINASQTGLSQIASNQKNLEVPKPGQRTNGRSSPSPTRNQTRTLSTNTRLGTSPDGLTRKLSPQDRLLLQEDGQSMAFYNLGTQRRDSLYSVSDRSTSLSPNPGRRRGSISSGHSEDEEGNSFVDAEERLSTDDMVCKTCGARTFNAFKVQSGAQKGETKLRCSVYISLKRI